MRKITILFLSIVFSISTHAGIIYIPSNASDNVKSNVANVTTNGFLVNDEITNRFKSDMDAFLKLTPGDYKKITGKKLSIKEMVELKAAQKYMKSKMKKGAEDKLPKAVYIILVILGWGFLALGLVSDWKGNDWWVNLLLTLLCWIPGVIHGLIKMKNYYN